MWIMLLPPGSFRYIKAEPPCWKGEVILSFHWFAICIGWQRGIK